MKHLLLLMTAWLLPLIGWAQEQVPLMMGDPISHIMIYMEKVDWPGGPVYRVYQSNAEKQQVRQIVVTTDRWAAAPDSILNAPDSIASGGGGYRLAALSRHELEEYKRRGKVWGEVFAFRNVPADTVPLGRGCMQVEVYPLGKCSLYPDIALELLTFEADGQEYLSVGPNKHPYQKEYNLDHDWRIWLPDTYRAYMASMGMK